MERALIVCDNEKGTAFYKSFLKENGFVDMIVAENAPEAKRIISDYDFDICLINGPIGGSSGEELSIDIAEKNICQVSLFIKAEYAEEIGLGTREYELIEI